MGCGFVFLPNKTHYTHWLIIILQITTTLFTPDVHLFYSLHPYARWSLLTSASSMASRRRKSCSRRRREKSRTHRTRTWTSTRTSGSCRPTFWTESTRGHFRRPRPRSMKPSRHAGSCATSSEPTSSPPSQQNIALCFGDCTTFCRRRTMTANRWFPFSWIRRKRCCCSVRLWTSPANEARITC